MLYVNVYLVSQLYGGAEEGGWYFDAGEPLGSIPIKTEYKPGLDYYCAETRVHVRQCDGCRGTGEVEVEDESYPERGTYMARCLDCGEVPFDLEATGKLMAEMQEMFQEEPGRYQHIQVMLQNHFAAPYPDRKPHYE